MNHILVKKKKEIVFHLITYYYRYITLEKYLSLPKEVTVVVAMYLLK